MAADAAPEKVIDIYEPNPRYWQYGGEPVLLLGGSVEDNLFQIPELERELDTLAAAGGNYVRCTMSSRDPGNVWAFAKEGDLYDLTRFNDEYWRRFGTFLTETERRGIIVQIEVWATFDFYRDNWDVNPFNPRNNVNYTAGETGLPPEVKTHPTRTENNFFWSVPAERNQETVLEYQRRFVDKLLAHSLDHGNALYCMDNETSVTPEWGAYWANYIRDAAEAAGRKVHTTEMWDPWDLDHPMHRATWQHPEIYTFVDVSQNNHQKGQAHYDNGLRLRRRITDPVRPVNNVKTYGADGGRFGDTRDGIERFWRSIFAGMASVRFHRPNSGIGLSERAQRMIRSARDVTDALEITRCEARPDLLSGHGENAAFCLAEPARQYAVYFPRGGTAKLDISGIDGGAELRWYDIDEGGWRPGAELQGDRDAELRTPGDGQWAAVIRLSDDWK